MPFPLNGFQRRVEKLTGIIPPSFFHQVWPEITYAKVFFGRVFGWRILWYPFLSRYETFTSNTTFPQAIFLANPVTLLMLLILNGFSLVVPRIIRSVIDDGLTRGESETLPAPLCASSPGAWACLCHLESGQPLLVGMDRGAGGL